IPQRRAKRGRPHLYRARRTHADRVPGRLAQRLRGLGPALEGQPRYRARPLCVRGRSARRRSLDRQVRGHQMTRRSGSCLRVAALAAGFLVGTLGGPGDAHAQSKTGTTVGTFLMIEPDARISGMGNAGVALDFGLDAVYYNPAAAGSLKQTALAFSHSEWIAGINYNHVTTAVPLGSAGVLLGSVTALTSG